MISDSINIVFVAISIIRPLLCLLKNLISYGIELMRVLDNLTSNGLSKEVLTELLTWETKSLAFTSLESLLSLIVILFIP
jgi:hypothetical protein